MIDCPFCSEKMRAVSPEIHKYDVMTNRISSSPAFRCWGCHVRIVVSNPSSLPESLIKEYWFLVKSKQLSKQENKNE